MTSIPELRRRAWMSANKSIDTLNSLNEIIFDGSPNKPLKIENKPENKNKISLKYIQEGIDVFNCYLNEIRQKKDYLVAIKKKHQECVSALSKITR